MVFIFWLLVVYASIISDYSKMMSIYLTAGPAPFIHYLKIEMEIPEPDRIVMKCMHKIKKTLCSKYKMSFCGYRMEGKIENMSLELQIKKILTKDEARTICLDCAEILLEEINSNEKLRPYLKDYPFTLENVGIGLFISDENFRDVFHPNVCVVRKVENIVYFRTDDPEKKYAYKDYDEETLEEALEFVKKYREEHLTTEGKNL